MSFLWPGNSSCGGSDLRVNQVCLEVESFLLTPVDVKFKTTECEECSFNRLGTILPNTTTSYVMNSSYALDLQVNGTCNITKWFDDLGTYYWKLNIGENVDCKNIVVKNSPEYFWVNITIAILTCAMLIIIMTLFKSCMKKNCFQRVFHRNTVFEELQNDTAESNSQRAEGRTRQMTRVTTIDVFRGASIALMVFVNYGGGQYSVFKHKPWNGLTIADVVFPFFIWIMGMSTVISLRSHLRASIDRKQIFLKIVWRSIVLICLGLILNSGKSHHTSLRIPGVLQRIGVTYFFVASIELFFGRPQISDRYGPWNRCVELVDAKLQWIFIVLLASMQVLISVLLPVPGCPTGYLGPGGQSEQGQFENCTGGAAGYIDRIIFTSRHIYQTPTSAKIYNSYVPYDPEGILGVLSSIVLAFFGAHCGRIIVSYEGSRSRYPRWLLWSVVMGISAGFLCGWSKSDGLIPVNKNLWSLSYVLATSSMASVVFSFLYWLIDDLKLWSGAPFLYAGMNSITIYLGHELLNKQLPWRWSPWTNTHLELLAMDISATGLWLIISYIMYTKKLFLSL